MPFRRSRYRAGTALDIEGQVETEASQRLLRVKNHGWILTDQANRRGAILNVLSVNSMALMKSSAWQTC